MEDELKVTAPGSTEQQTSSAAPASAPLEPTAEAAPATDDAKRERDRLAQAGRERAEAERRATRAEQLVAQQAAELNQLRNDVAGIKSTMTAQQQAEQEAALAALPPVERNARQIEILQAQLAERDAIAYQQRRERELLQQANEAFGLTGAAMLTGNEAGLDKTSEQGFINSLRAYGAAAQKFATRSTPQTEEEPPVAKKDEQTPEERIQAGIEAGLVEIRRELGIGRSNAPRAAAAASGDAESIQTGIQDTLRNYNNRRPGETREALRKSAADAARLAPGGRRA